MSGLPPYVRASDTSYESRVSHAWRTSALAAGFKRGRITGRSGTATKVLAPGAQAGARDAADRAPFEKAGGRVARRVALDRTKLLAVSAVQHHYTEREEGECQHLEQRRQIREVERGQRGVHEERDRGGCEEQP